MNKKIPLKVEIKESVFDGKVMMETINISNLNKLLKSLDTDDLLKSYDKISKTDIYTNEFVKNTYNTERTQLIKYAENIKFGKSFVQYDKVHKMGGIGRVFPKKSLGLFSFRKQLRGALAYGLYVDIDISNCHPCLMMQILQHNNIDCKYLCDYVNDRSKYLELVMKHYEVSKDKAKELFIMLLYFGSFKKWAEINNIDKEEIEIVSNFRTELKNIGKIIYENNQEIAKIITDKLIITKQNTKKKNIIGSTVSFVLQEWECQIIETIFIYCTDKKIINNDSILCADGIMIKKNKYYDNLLNEFNLIIKEKLGFDLLFVNKPMDTELFDKLL